MEGAKKSEGAKREAKKAQREPRELSILEELDLNFGEAKNKTQIIHALERSHILHRIPIFSQSVSTEQARKDFVRERVLLNDVPFIPDRVDLHRCSAFAFTLQTLLARLTRAHPHSYSHTHSQQDASIAEIVMQRACRTSAGADSFFMVQKLLCSEGTFVTQRAFPSDAPIRVDVFVAEEGQGQGQGQEGEQQHWKEQGQGQE
ncbi:hypothetical protein B484DRAFT_37923, partial [Ochromonadaceae sp. CCMP2298]